MYCFSKAKGAICGLHFIFDSQVIIFYSLPFQGFTLRILQQWKLNGFLFGFVFSFEVMEQEFCSSLLPLLSFY